MHSNRSARTPRPVSVCSFTFADGRQCRIPRCTGHSYLCLFHAKKEAQILAGEQAGQDIASFLQGSYISACDLSSALARLFCAVAQGHIKPKTAATLAYLGQTLAQILKQAEHEYINAFGSNGWRNAVRESFAPPTPPPPAPPRSPAPSPTAPQPSPNPPPRPVHQQAPVDADPQVGHSHATPPPTPPSTVPQPPAGSASCAAQTASAPPGAPTLLHPAGSAGCISDWPVASSPQSHPSANQSSAPNAPQNPSPLATPPSPGHSDDYTTITINGTQITGRLRDF